MPKTKNADHLNERQEAFCKFIISEDFNQTKAALKAGYAEKSAHTTASRMLKDPKITKRINELIEETLNLQKGQLKYKVLKELNAIAFADVTNDINVITKEYKEPIYDEEGKITDKTKTKNFQTVEIIDTKKSTQSKAIASIKQDAKGCIEIKYHDKEKALEMIGKFGGLFPDKVDVNLSGGLTKNTFQIVDKDGNEVSPETPSTDK